MTLPADSEKRAVVAAMFDRIAPRYDLLNRLMTFGVDRGWRRRTIAALGLRPGERVLDLACGSGDLAEEAAAAGARVIAIDFSAGMLRVARARQAALAPRGADALAPRAANALAPRAADALAPPTPCALVRGDALALPLVDGAVDAVVSGFALRNFVDLGAALTESARVLRPGGRIALLEVDRPASALLRFGHAVYFRRVVPLLGALLADRDAYAYLPESAAYLPDEPRLFAMLRIAGFTALRKRPLLGGAAQLLTAERRLHA